MNLTRPLGLTLALAGAAVSQANWIVDSNNGPGTDFKTIQAAIDAAKRGDLLTIRRGDYDGFTLSKGLRLLADTGAVVRAASGIFGKPVLVKDTPAGSFVTLRGLTITDARASGRSVQVEANKGMVQFESVKIQVPSTGTAAESVSIRDSIGVSFQACDVPSGIAIANSAVMLTESKLTRIRNAAHLFGSRPALSATKSRVTLAHCNLQGQVGVTPYNESHPGVHSIASSIRITGLRTSSIRAGGAGSERVPALLGDAASSLMLDPRPSLVPYGGAGAHEGFGKVERRQLSYLGVHGGKIGGTMSLEQHGAAGHFFALSASLPHTPFHWPPFGHLWLDQSVRIHILAGLYDTSGTLKLSFKIANEPRLRGIPLGWHAVSGPWPNLVYSNAVFTTLH